MQFYVMTRTHVRQFKLLQVAKCHSAISWIMSNSIPWLVISRGIRKKLSTHKKFTQVDECQLLLLYYNVQELNVLRNQQSYMLWTSTIINYVLYTSIVLQNSLRHLYWSFIELTLRPWVISHFRSLRHVYGTLFHSTSSRHLPFESFKNRLKTRLFSSSFPYP